MHYKPETIKKYLAIALHALALAKTSKETRVHITKGNKKIGHTWNVSLLPIVTCGNCKECKKYCYDIKSCMMYTNVIDCRAANTAMMQADMRRYFEDIAAFIDSRRSNKFFRWHVAGDIVNARYFDYMVKIAKYRPGWTFWTYTKRYDIVNAYASKHMIPRNLHIMFSKWEGVDMDNPHNFPEFRVRMEGMSEDAFKGLWKCPGNCDICKAAHRGCVASETSYVDEH